MHLRLLGAVLSDETLWALIKRTAREWVREKPRHAIVAAVALLCLVFYAGYPWTKDQCYEWAASRATEVGVHMARNFVCGKFEK